MRALAFVSAIFLSVAAGQTPAPVTFDVATIKQSPPFEPGKVMSGQMRMGVKIDGARAEYSMMSLHDLICKAYDIKAHQLTGPDWMKTTRWDIQATMPEGSKQDQAPAMLQALLKERFKLEFHKDTKELNVYALIQGKGGSKLKEAEPDPAPAPEVEGAPKEEASGKDAKGGAPSGSMTVNGEKMTMKQTSNGVVMRGGEMGQVKTSFANGVIHMEYAKMTMARFTEMLTQFVDRPVNDETQLTGKYQVTLDMSMQEMMALAKKAGMNPGGGMGGPGGPGGGGPAGGAPRPAEAAGDPEGATIFQAVEQMGLKLAPRKGPVAMIVVDRIEKTPTEN